MMKHFIESNPKEDNIKLQEEGEKKKGNMTWQNVIGRNRIFLCNSLSLCNRWVALEN